MDALSNEIIFAWMVGSSHMTISRRSFNDDIKNYRVLNEYISCSSKVWYVCAATLIYQNSHYQPDISSGVGGCIDGGSQRNARFGLVKAERACVLSNNQFSWWYPPVQTTSKGPRCNQSQFYTSASQVHRATKNGIIFVWIVFKTDTIRQ